MEPLYADRLVEIFPDRIVFRRYYLPLHRYGSRQVALTALATIEKHDNSLRNGRWRIWGTGDLRTWYPYDGARPSRSCVFLAIPAKPDAMRIGFTAEDPDALSRVLADLELLDDRTESRDE